MTKTTDSFSWANPFGGAWGTASNWLDTTANTTTTSPPGASGTVTITGGTSTYTDITGTGAAASLSVSNDVLLWGTVAVGGALKEATSTDLELDGAAKLTAASATLQTGTTLEAGDASTIDIAGAISITAGILNSVSGSIVQVGTLIANGGSYYETAYYTSGPCP